MISCLCHSLALSRKSLKSLKEVEFDPFFHFFHNSSYILDVRVYCEEAI